MMVRAAATKVEIQADSDVAAKVLHARGMPEFHIFSCRPDFSSGQKHIDPANSLMRTYRQRHWTRFLKKSTSALGRAAL